MQQTIALSLLLALSACNQEPLYDYNEENLCVEDGFQYGLFGRALTYRYVPGTSVHFVLTHPYEGAETHIELKGDAFDWELMDDGSVMATAMESGSAELVVFIGGEVVSSTPIDVVNVASVVFYRDSGFLNSYQNCGEDCIERVALGATTRLQVRYNDAEGRRLAGRGLGDDDFVRTGSVSDEMDLFTDIEGLFALPLNVAGEQLGMLRYEVTEIATFRISGGGRTYHAHVLDADDNGLITDVEWEVDGEILDVTTPILFLGEDATPTDVRARVAGLEATYDEDNSDTDE